MEAGNKRDGGNRRENPQGPTETCTQAEGGNRGSNDAGHDGRRRHAVRGAEQAAEAGGRWVWEKSRRMESRASKGGGERV